LSTTFDNSFNTGPYVLTDPANPDGLGPSSSSNGCSFFYSSGLPSELVDNVFVARFNGPITEASPGTDTLDYRDIVAVDTTTGKVRRIASGFARPLSLFWDGAQRLLIGDYGDKYLYALVALDNTGTNLTVTNLSAAAGQSVTLSALMRRSADGVPVPGKTITFKIDTTTVGTAVTASNGVASLKYSVPVSLGAGTHVITANFAGDADYGPNGATGSLMVYFDTRLTVPNIKANTGQTVPLQATLRRDPDGAAVPGKTIAFTIGTTGVGTAVTGADGVATLNYTVPASFATGNYTITATFAGDAAYHSSTQTGKLQALRR
jgi:Big-like domain-containing protein